MAMGGEKLDRSSVSSFWELPVVRRNTEIRVLETGKEALFCGAVSDYIPASLGRVHTINNCCTSRDFLLPCAGQQSIDSPRVQMWMVSTFQASGSVTAAVGARVPFHL